jgi:hypothetical protein
MLIFRSEEHLGAWVEKGNPRGETLTSSQQWDLARRWFRGRHLPDWERRTPAEAEEIFASVGLTSDFWSF